MSSLRISPTGVQRQEIVYRRASGSLDYHLFDRDMQGADAIADDPVVRSTGLELIPIQAGASVRLRLVRFHSFVIARVTARSIQASWDRSQGTARTRYLCLLINRGSVEVDDEVGVIRPSRGVCILPPASTPAQFQADGDVEAVVLSFDQDEIRPYTLEAGSDTEMELTSPVFGSAFAYFSGLLHASKPETHRTVDVLYQLTRSFSRGLIREAQPSEMQTRQVSTLADRAVQVAEFRASTVSFTPARLAQELGVSRRTLDRALARQGYQTAFSLIRGYRTRRALDLMREHPQASLAEVAELCGFGSAVTLRRAIRGLAGGEDGSVG